MNKNSYLDQTPILNKTQRRYTLSHITYEPPKEIQNTSISPVVNISESPQVFAVEQTKKYCLVDFDFRSENENELGCLSGDYLQLIEFVDESNEWFLAENIYGKRGLVPLNFVTVILRPNPTIEQLFEKKLISMNENLLEQEVNESLSFLSNQILIKNPLEDEVNQALEVISSQIPSETLNLENQVNQSLAMIATDINNAFGTQKLEDTQVSPKKLATSINIFEEKIKQLQSDSSRIDELKQNNFLKRMKKLDHIERANSLQPYALRETNPFLTDLNYRPPIPPKPTLSPRPSGKRPGLAKFNLKSIIQNHLK